MIRPLVELLADASDHARRAAAHVEDIEFAAFAADTMRRQAVCFCLVVVGEACDGASKELHTLPSDIPWREIKAMRNILVHEYWQIQDAIVYNVARHEASRLADRLDEVAKRLER